MLHLSHVLPSQNYSNMMGVSSGVGTEDHSRAPEFITDFSGVRVARSLVFCVVLCILLLVLLLFFICLAIVLSVLLHLFGHCVVCPSSSNGFWLPICYHQTLLIHFISFSMKTSCFRPDSWFVYWTLRVRLFSIASMHCVITYILIIVFFTFDKSLYSICSMLSGTC
jgi:hypothetical protein